MWRMGAARGAISLHLTSLYSWMRLSWKSCPAHPSFRQWRQHRMSNLIAELSSIRQRHLSTKEVATIIGTSVATVIRYMASGKLLPR